MNIATLLRNAAQQHGDRIALSHGDRHVSYRQLAEDSARFGSALRGRGLNSGDRVALFMKNSPEFVIALFGAWWSGLVVVPINAKLVLAELETIVGDAGATTLLISPDKAPIVGDAFDEVEVVVTDSADFAQLLAEGDPGAPVAESEADDLAWLFYTSGTTGTPKGAQLSHRNLITMTMAELADVCAFDREDRVLHIAPLSHGGGLYLMGSIARGAENIISPSPSFDPDATLRLIESRQITVIGFLAPTMIAMLLDAAPDADTSSLRCVIYGGGPIHVETSKRMLDRFGPVFVQIYGMGESPMTITYRGVEDHDPEDAATLASAGVRHPGVDVIVVDDQDRPLPPGEEGQVCVRGDVVMTGYWGNPEATAAALRGGWLHTGDVGAFDTTGRLFLLDRSNDTIISGGTNIYPREVEDVLLRHEAIREVAVFGVPDMTWGESVVAAVVCEPGKTADEAELIDFCKAHLASFKKPKSVVFVDELPRNAYGKVLRRDIRARVLSSYTST